MCKHKAPNKKAMSIVETNSTYIKWQEAANKTKRRKPGGKV